MNRIKKIELMIERTAALAANASSLRSQGPSGTINRTRKFLKALPLKSYKVRSERSFQKRLDFDTEKLANKFPRGNWGAARKIINIFLRDVFYNRYLCDHFGFDDIENWLEVPLDGLVAKGLLKGFPHLPAWPKIIWLDCSTSKKYQSVAKEMALKEKIAPVHPDLIFWRRLK